MGPQVKPLTHGEVRRLVAEHDSRHEGCRALAECEHFTQYAFDCFSRYPYRGAHDRILRLCCQLRPLTEQSAIEWLAEYAEYTRPGEFEGWPMMKGNRALIGVVLKTTELLEPVHAHIALLRLTRTLALYQSLRKDVNVYHRLRAAFRRAGSSDAYDAADALVRAELLQWDSGRTGPHDPFNIAACKAIASNMPRYHRMHGEAEDDYAVIADLLKFVGAEAYPRQNVRVAVVAMREKARAL